MDWQNIINHGLGTREFDSLSSLEQDIALVCEFDTEFEMEGYFGPFFTHSGENVERLVAFMERFGSSNVDPIRRVVNLVQSNAPSWDQDDVDRFFCNVSDDMHAQIIDWGLEYLVGVDRMWDELDDFLEKEGLPRYPFDRLSNPRQINEDRFCCEVMRLQLTHECEQHPNPFDCPDVLVVYWPYWDEFGIPVRDGGPSVSHISFCPWCGAALPESKRDLYFEYMKQMGIEDLDDTNIPAEFRDDSWWRGRPA